MSFIEELRWRGLLHDMSPGTEELLGGKSVKGYVGFDPTADSLHIGSLVPIMLLVHLQRHGHSPIALVGGATGMVGDPSGKSAERNLLSMEELEHNVRCVKAQLERFLDFETAGNPARLVNNFDWFKGFGFLDFIRDVGKHITINYMLSKESVKKRAETGLSFTEFTYQLVQGYDFLYLYKNYDCVLQLGGSDQWGNMTTGLELIRRKEQGDAYVVTCPLVTKADGTKFGKTEEGNVWLDENRTSSYKFYQFWLNTSDEDARSYIRIFTLLDRDHIEELERRHAEAPHQRILQHALAEDITVRVHGREAYDTAVTASQILFGKSTRETLESLTPSTLREVFEGVPISRVSRDVLSGGMEVMELLVEQTGIFSSRGEARRMIQGGGLNLNQEKVEDEVQRIDTDTLINGQFLVIRKGKKNYHLILVN